MFSFSPEQKENMTYLDLGIGGSIFLILSSIGRWIDIDAMVSNVLTNLSRGSERKGGRRGRRGTEGSWLSISQISSQALKALHTRVSLRFGPNTRHSATN